MTDLMAWSWDNGPLPEDEQALARLGGVTVRRFRYLWLVIGQKWIKTEKGYINARLEKCREEKAAFQAMASGRGRQGAEKRWNKHASSNAQPMQGAMQNHGSPISDLRSPISEDQDPTASRAVEPDQDHSIPLSAKTELNWRSDAVPPIWRKPAEAIRPHSNPDALVDGSALRRHGGHAYCPGRDGLCIPRFLHDEFKGKGRKSDTELHAWYRATMETFADAAIGDDGLVFWRNEFARWIGTVTAAPRDTPISRMKAAALRLKAEGVPGTR